MLTIQQKKSENFGWKSNGTVIFRKIRSESVDFLQRQEEPSFFVRNRGTMEIFLAFGTFSSFQYLISRIAVTIRYYSDKLSSGSLHFSAYLDVFSSCSLRTGDVKPILR